jgi:hypothetical protein
VHAVRLQHGFKTVPFIEEGLATMLGTARPFVPFSARVTASNPDLNPILFLDRDWDQATFSDYVVGAHFLHWTDTAYGRDPFLDFLWSDDLRVAQSSEAIQAAFAASIGETMLDAQTRWSDEAEREATFSDLCWGMDTATLPAEGLHVQASACCSDPTVEQSEPPWLNVGRRCFTVPDSMELTATLDAAEGELILRPDGCYGPVVTLDPGETITFTATPCVWQALVFTTERCDDASGVRYSIDPQ